MLGKVTRGIGVSICLLLMQGCSLDITPNLNLQKEKFFFSTDQYFNSEIDRLANKRGYTKSVNFNGQQESMELDTLNLAQEFVPFIKSDINKVIWSDQYSCDSTLSNQQLIKLKCNCLNPKLKTQELVVDFDKSSPSKILIKNQMSKILMVTSESLEYNKDESYQIKRVQSLRSGGVDSTLVKVTF